MIKWKQHHYKYIQNEGVILSGTISHVTIMMKRIDPCPKARGEVFTKMVEMSRISIKAETIETFKKREKTTFMSSK